MKQKILLLIFALFAVVGIMKAEEYYLVGGCTDSGWSSGVWQRSAVRAYPTGASTWACALKLTTGEGDDGRFKIPNTSGGWDGFWAPAQGTVLTSEWTDLNTSGEGDNKFCVAEEGYYLVTFDTATKKIKAEKLTAPTKVGDYYQIGTLSDYYWFAAYIATDDTKNAKAQLTADLDFSGAAFLPLASDKHKFKGEFDGQTHAINNATLDCAYNFVGLFTYIGDGAYIHDLTIGASCSFKGNAKVAGIAGFARDGGTVTLTNVINCATITGSNEGKNINAAGLIGCSEDGTKIIATNCANAGNVSGANECAAFCGWCQGGTTFTNCWNVGDISGIDGSNQLYRNTSAAIVNCFDLTTIGNQGTKVEKAKMATGEFCYTLNGDQSSINWYQAVGTDNMPYPFASHGQVYANGELKCDGTSAGGALTYSNSNESVIPPHTFGANGMCSVCNHAGAQPTLTDGVYQIANIGNLFWFSNFVNAGNTAANAALTADVEQGTVELQPIGNPSNLYSGTFDGKFNSVTLNMNNASSDYQGLFGAVTGGATFKNLIVKGSVKGKASVGGIVGGSTGGGTITFTNCGNEAEVTASGKNGAGLFGVNMLSAATVTFTNCYNTGDITSSSEGGAISGWIGDGSKGSAVTNCFNIGKITNGDFVRSNGGKLTNTYDKRNGEAEIASGELCYNLNGNQANIAFYQTIGTDAYPTLISSRGQVYRLEGPTYANTNEVDGVFQISNPYELIAFSKYVNAGNNSANGRLTADIDMKDVANFTPIGLFSDDPVYNPPTPSYNGTFDGNNHVIKNLTITLDEPFEAGLFSRCVGSSSVSNLGIIGANITSNAGIRTGVIAGLTSTKIRGCYTQDVTITTSNAQKGGIAGVFYTSGASPTKCYTTYETLGTMDSGAGADVSFAGSDVTTMGPTGELCWKLTDDSFKPTAAWRQNIGTDEYPTRDTSHGFVQKISAAGYATQSLAEDVTIPAGMKAYAGKVNGQYMTLTEIENKIPANTGVVLEAAAGFYSFVPTTGAAAVADNDLVAAVEKVTKANIKGNYVLAVVDEVVGFYEATNAAALAAGKAYLPASAVTAGVKAVTFGTPTSLISPIEEKEEGAPVIYDLSGRRVEKATKGLYIINGKKILK